MAAPPGLEVVSGRAPLVATPPPSLAAAPPPPGLPGGPALLEHGFGSSLANFYSWAMLQSGVPPPPLHAGVPPPPLLPPSLLSTDASDRSVPPLMPPVVPPAPVVPAPAVPPPPMAPPTVTAPALEHDGGMMSQRLSDGPPVAPALGSPGMPTVGSLTHGSGTCKPCAFVHSKGCSTGVSCQFCHLCSKDERKRRKKEERKKTQTRY